MVALILLGLALHAASGVAAATHAFDGDHVSLIQAVDIQEPTGRRMQYQHRPVPQSSPARRRGLAEPRRVQGGPAGMRKMEAPQMQQAQQVQQAQPWPMAMAIPAGGGGPQLDTKSLRAELGKADKQLAEDLKLFINLRGEKEHLMADNAELQRVVAGHNEEMKQQAATVETLQGQLEAANRALSELRAKQAGGEPEAPVAPTEAPSDSPSVLRALNPLSSGCEEERSGVLTMQGRLDEALSKQQELEQSNKVIQELHHKLKDEKNAVIEEYTRVMKENTRLADANTKLTALNEGLTKQNAKLKDGLDRFKGVLQHMP